MSTKPVSAARLIAFVLLVQWLLLVYVLRFSPGTRIAPFSGDDFIFFYSAAGYFLSGHSPYLESGFIPLPSALMVPLALHWMPYARAASAYKVINGAVVIAAMLWLCRELRLTRANAALVMVITLTYGPFYSVVGEGNLDALMMALLVASCARHRLVRAVALGLSIGTKFYSLLLLPVWVVQRRWREILLGAAVLAMMLLPFAPYLADALHRVTQRTAIFFIVGNQSPAVLFVDWFGYKRKWLWHSCYAALWGGTLLLRLVCDACGEGEEQRRWLALKYLPWMASAPILVFYYTSVILLPFGALLVAVNQQRSLRRFEWLMVLGFILTGLYPLVFNLDLIWPFEPLFKVLAPIGLTLILVGNGATALLEQLEQRGKGMLRHSRERSSVSA
jgi:hypothetical protein